MNPKIVIASVLAVIILVIVIAVWPFSQISAGERGVVLHLGKVDRILEEGLHVVTPLIEDVKVIDVSTQKDEVGATAASKDLQTVSANVAINFSVDPAKVEALWTNFKGEHVSRVVSPSIQEAVKAQTAKYTAEELIIKREIVKNELLVSLRESLSSVGILVENLFITDFDFSAQFNAAIEAKVTAEQSALAAKNKLQQVQFEADQRVAQAKAEAEAIRIQAQAVTQQGGEDYVRLQAIEKWNGVLPTQFIPGQSLPFLNVIR